MKKLLSLFVMLLCISGMNAAEVKVKLTQSMFKQWYSETTGEALATPNSTGCDYNVGSSNGMLYGNSSVKWYTYADLTKYKKLVMYVSEGTPRLMYNREMTPGNPGADGVNHVEISKNVTDGYLTVSGDVFTYDLEGMATAKGFVHLNAIKGANWANVTVTKMYLVKEGVLEADEEEFIEELPDDTPVITCKRGDEVDPRTAPWYTRPDAATEYSLVPYAAEFNINTSTAAYFGVMWSGENLNNYADLSAYKAIRVYQANSGNLPRAFFVNEAGNTHSQVLGFEWNAAFGYYELDLQKAMDAYGNCKLTTLRATGSSTCTGVSLVPKERNIDYILSGTGELSDAALFALNDANACVYDATGITATGVALTTANPNAIIIANEGTIANDHNVLVDGFLINKLQLTDGYPLVLPRGASTAVSGSYTRTVTKQYSTACLPLCFEFTGEGVYQFVGMDGDVINFIKIEDMRGLKGSYPWLLVGAGEINMYDGGQIYHDSTFEYDTFTGTYSGKTLTSDANKTYYGIKDDKIVKVGNNVTVAPFRAYFQFDTASEAKSLKLNLGDETAINSVVEGLNSARAFYNAAGVRQNGLQKGLNIVEMSNGVTRKIMIK